MHELTRAIIAVLRAPRFPRLLLIICCLVLQESHRAASTAGWLLSHPCACVSAAWSVFAVKGYLSMSLKAAAG